MPIKKKSSKMPPVPAPRNPEARRQSEPFGQNLELPSKKERSPSFFGKLKEIKPVKPDRPKASLDVPVEVPGGDYTPAGTRRGGARGPILPPPSRRKSDATEVTASPRTSLEVSSPSSPDTIKDNNDSCLRDSGLGEMGEAEVQIRFENETVLVLKQNIDEHYVKLCKQLENRKEELKSKLDSYLTKSCLDINEGKGAIRKGQKVEFHAQNDIGFGVITFTDESDDTRDIINYMQVNSLRSQQGMTIYENMENYYNVKRVSERQNSTGSDTSEGSYENMSSQQPLILPESAYDITTKEDWAITTKENWARPPIPSPAPHYNRQQSTPGYINTDYRPELPPKPNFLKN